MVDSEHVEFAMVQFFPKENLRRNRLPRPIWVYPACMHVFKSLVMYSEYFLKIEASVIVYYHFELKYDVSLHLETVVTFL